VQTFYSTTHPAYRLFRCHLARSCWLSPTNALTTEGGGILGTSNPFLLRGCFSIQFLIKKNFSTVKNTIFTLFLLVFVQINLVFATDNPNNCRTYSCGCCCSHDTKPCCNPGYKPGLAPPQNTTPITTLRRTYSRNSLATRSSAITITETDITTAISVGNSQQNFFMSIPTDSTTMNIGIADATNAQTWTIPNDAIAKLDWTNRIDFIASTAVPTAASALHPTASHWSKQSVTREGVAYTLYEAMHLNTGSHIDLAGKIHIRDSDGQDFVNTGISGIIAHVDVNLGDNFSTYAAYAEPNNTNFNNYSNGTLTIDGYGTIATPYGTLNCLRASLMTESQLYNNSTGFAVGTPDTAYWVVWFTKEGFRFYGRKLTETASGTVVLKNLQMQRIAPTTVLPVELLNFSAKNSDNQQVAISWETASEKNNAAFDVQKSSNGKSFKTFATVKGKVNSSEKQSYSLLDETPSVGHNYYRLRQVDTDGKETFSKVNYVWIAAEKGILHVYPNPAKANLTIECEKATDVTIVNALGQVVKTVALRDGLLGQSPNIVITDLAEGIYFVKAVVNGSVETVQFVKN
jgi:hypothetical protein